LASHREHVLESHEPNELTQLWAGTTNAHAAPVAARGEGKPGERVDGDGIHLDALQLTEEGLGADRLEQRASAHEQSLEITALDGTSDPQDRAVRRIDGHRRPAAPRLARLRFAARHRDLAPLINGFDLTPGAGAGTHRSATALLLSRSCTQLRHACM